MATIYAFPHSFNPKSVHRIAEELEQALSSGTNLGPRSLQIRALGRSLQQLGQELESKIASMDANLSVTPAGLALQESFRRMSDVYLRLTMLAQFYPIDD